MDLDTFWHALLLQMESRIGHQDVEIWLGRVRPVRLHGRELLLEVPNRYYSDWIAENYQEQLVEVASAKLDLPIEIRFSQADDPTVEEATDSSSSSAESPGAPIESGERAIGINQGQTFDNFVIGECNKFAHAAAGAVADYPAGQYNPLFIYGSTGLGKTHLLHSIGNQILGSDPKARVVYVTAEDFMNEMINCIRHKRMEDFRSKYRKRATVLLVDDIQFLSGRDRTQEEFFHTFNALQGSGRQIVLISDVEPKHIEKLEPRLRTRFEGGLIADMQAPDAETLLAILRQKADQQGLLIPADLADAIAAHVAGNIRELEGVLNRLAALHRFYQTRLTLEFARDRLPGLFEHHTPDITVAQIIATVARMHNIPGASITGNKRTRALTFPRHIAMYLARKHTDRSFPDLGREFGGRDHSTVQHGVKKIEKALKTDADLSYKIQLIEQDLGIRTQR